MKKHRVFVYGTLKRGLTNHRLLVESDFIGAAYTVDTFRMYHVGFPVIFFDNHPDAKAVYGEVYDVDDETLARLDSLESEGHMYDRRPINVVLEHDDRTIDANVNVYIGNGDYWEDIQSHQEHVDVNEHDELVWPHAA
jgi:gamma-glutamylaminecyclotransferase